jgi:hypothetical protein
MSASEANRVSASAHDALARRPTGTQASWRVVLMVALVVAFGAAAVVAVLVGASRHGETAQTLGNDVLLRDTFVRHDDALSLGRLKDGPQWHAVAGAWGIHRGQAYVADPAEPASLAVIETPGRPEEIAVTLTHVENNAGLVFRYRDEKNYWAVLAAPKYAIWYVIKVLDGKTETVAKTGLQPVLDPTRITVRLSGNVIEVWAEWGSGSTPPKRFSDPDNASARRAGLIAVGEEAAHALFQNFAVTR